MSESELYQADEQKSEALTIDVTQYDIRTLTGDQLAVYSVSVVCGQFSWQESCNSEVELKALILGIKAAATVLGCKEIPYPNEPYEKIGIDFFETSDCEEEKDEVTPTDLMNNFKTQGEKPN